MVLLPATNAISLVESAQVLSDAVRPNEKLLEEPFTFTAMPVLPILA
jgi:hypothetical protein